MSVLAAVLLGEGVWALRNVADTTSSVYWTLEIAVGTVLVAVATLRARLWWPAALVCIVTWLVGSAAFLVLVEALLGGQGAVG